jgi:C-terminal processing protease CtpA/Prc
MNESSLIHIANAALGAGGMGVMLVLAFKWFVGDYFKKAEENRTLEKQAVDSRITDLRNVAGDIKIEVIALKDRFLHTEKLVIQAVERLNSHAEKFAALTEALKGFVRSANDRMNVIESKADKVIVKVGEITRSKKTGSE